MARPPLKLLTVAVAITVLTTGLWTAPTYGLMPPWMRSNTSPSVPLGRWWYTTKWPPERGDIVLMRDPPGFKLNWLLKRVEGVGGDLFCWHERRQQHSVNGRWMTPIHPLALDHNLPIWRGCRLLDPDEIAGFGETLDSYGSAYFGPVKLEKIWGVYRQW